RFITSSGFITKHKLLKEDIDIVLDEDNTRYVEDVYRIQGILQPNEKLKPLWATNVVVRNRHTGRFMKWKHV
ncbi:UNVERIFIED_CONTAM: hypothetical protein RF648_22100, partial [Kocuria sp. CPCC 205274]